MRAVVAVDWTDETFSAVQALTRLYEVKEIDLVHAVDVRPFESPLFAPAMAKEAYAEFRQALVNFGQQLLEQTAALIPPDAGSVRRLCEMGAPAEVVLDTVRAASADLVVLGARGRGRISELVLGSVSHKVLLKVPCSTLIIKRSLVSCRRVLLAIEGADDAERLQSWLLAHPFKHSVELTVFNVVPNPYFGDPGAGFAYASWMKEAEQFAEQLVQNVASALNGTHYSATTQVIRGFPAEEIAKVAENFDLVVVSSHGRKAIARFLLGSVSHSLVHRVTCPVLVVRP